MSAYGIPYKGGKSKIVKWVIETLPPNELTLWKVISKMAIKLLYKLEKSEL